MMVNIKCQCGSKIMAQDPLPGTALKCNACGTGYLIQVVPENVFDQVQEQFCKLMDAKRNATPEVKNG